MSVPLWFALAFQLLVACEATTDAASRTGKGSYEDGDTVTPASPDDTNCEPISQVREMGDAPNTEEPSKVFPLKYVVFRDESKNPAHHNPDVEGSFCFTTQPAADATAEDEGYQPDAGPKRVATKKLIEGMRVRVQFEAGDVAFDQTFGDPEFITTGHGSTLQGSIDTDNGTRVELTLVNYNTWLVPADTSATDAAGPDWSWWHASSASSSMVTVTLPSGQ